jgi:hypothetical protein
MRDKVISTTVLMRVGKHECVTCQRCACTFAAVHPACPRCSEEFRKRAEVERLRERVTNYERYVEREIEPKLLGEVERLRLEMAKAQDHLRPSHAAYKILGAALAGQENR